MFRFLGFLTGAALTIGALVMVLGPPELRDELQTAVADVATPLAEGVTSDEFKTALGETLDEIIVTAKRLPEVVAESPPLAATPEPAETLVELPPPPSVEPASPATMVAEAEPPSDILDEAAPPAAPAHDSHWQSIWNPFRSQIAANGFAARLAAVTDIDYRVVRLKPGAYQVTFAYADDNERMAKLAEIQGATGLDLPEGQL